MVNWASALRKELSETAKCFATAKGLTHYESRGGTVLFPGDAATSRHGNFNDDGYAAILANAKWAERLKKPHSQRRALPPDRRDDAKELDSSNSSDALLMNCFCYPGAAERILEECLPSIPTEQVEFGVAGKVPLRDGSFDRTELDMRAGEVIFESKLTEADFTSKRRKVVEAYRDLLDVFDAGVLPPIRGRVPKLPVDSQRIGGGCVWISLCPSLRWPSARSVAPVVGGARSHPESRSASAYPLLAVAGGCRGLPGPASRIPAREIRHPNRPIAA